MSLVLLLLSSPGASLDPVRAALRGVPDLVPIDGDGCRDLVRQVATHAPDQVVVAAPAEDLAEALAAWGGEPPCPVSGVGEMPAGDLLARLMELGIAGWWPDPAALRTGLAFDRLRWAREAAVRRELADVKFRFDERKWVDRAKGVLAAARGLDEDEAFRLLRGAAMQAKLKIGDVSRSVIEAATWAEALNQAGQLRMLSQRVVKLAAQQVAGVDVHRTRRLQQACEARAVELLGHLMALRPAGMPGDGPLAAVAATQEAWTMLADALAHRNVPGWLGHVDTLAEALLSRAEALVETLEATAGRHALQVVNLCGRQRMLSQRLVKEALLAELLGDAERHTRLVPLQQRFESALAELEAAPLSNAEIREALQAARDEWLKLLHGLRSIDRGEGRLALSRASENLLEGFDRLTGLYEHSLHVLMS